MFSASSSPFSQYKVAGWVNVLHKLCQSLQSVKLCILFSNLFIYVITLEVIENLDPQFRILELELTRLSNWNYNLTFLECKLIKYNGTSF